MSIRTFCPYAPALLAAALLCAPAAYADPGPASPAMQKAFTQLEQGPDQLRRFVQRTRMIYALNYAEVVAAHDAKRAAEAPPQLAESQPAVASAKIR